jgi:hypothetical protein
MRSKRRRIRWEAPLAGLVVAGIAAGTIGCAAAGTASYPAVTPHLSTTVHASPRAAAIGPLASGSLVIGKPYLYRLFIHCGVRKVAFGGRTWSPVQPVQQYQGNRPVHGITTVDGYVVGTMTLERAGTLRFAANNAIAKAPFAVLFERAATSGIGPPCS